MPPGSLEDLLIAEIALNQGDTKTAFERLDKQVKQTGDLRLALRAARIATQLESDVSLQAALQLDGIERSYESLALLAGGTWSMNRLTRALGRSICQRNESGSGTGLSPSTARRDTGLGGRIGPSTGTHSPRFGSTGHPLLVCRGRRNQQ